MKAFDFETEYKQTIVGDRFVEKKIEALDEKKAYYFAKRIFDILLSLTGIILSILPSIIIVALIKMTSEGPVFFFQERLGQFGKPFMIIKFRTMMAEAEKDLGPVWAENDDKRTTKIGKVLRKTHLDELPQLINVLKGEMSMVGPRPEREYFYKEFAKKLLQYQNDRLELINKIKDIFLKMNNLPLPTLERDNNIVDIDPFTVFGLFNKGITNNNRLELLSLIKEYFGINAEIPKDFNGIPVLNNQKATFYYFIGDRKIPKMRTFYEISVYFYLYDDEFFVIDKPLKTKRKKLPHTKQESLRIKVLYSRLRRSINHSKMKQNLAQHVAEHVWKYENEYYTLFKSLVK